MRKSTIAATLSAAVLAGGVLAGTPAQAFNLITNGGFETGDFTGWSSTGNNAFDGVQCPGPGPTVAEGNCSAFFGPIGSSLGFLSQTVATTAGNTYELHFSFSADGGTPSEFLVQWDGAPLMDILNPPAGGFKVYSFLVTGTGSDTVSFGFRDDPGFLFLDNVGVVPEPASLALLGFGLAGLGWARRRRG